jgi:hypothetical protein
MWKDLIKYNKVSKSKSDKDDGSSDGSKNRPEMDISHDDDDEDDIHAAIAEVDSGAVIYSCQVEVITIASNDSGAKTIGTLEISKSRITFTRLKENEKFNFLNTSGNDEFMWACACYPSNSWPVTEICQVSKRLYLLQRVAMEIFFTTRTSIFINAFSTKTLKKLYKVIMNNVRPPNLITPLYGSVSPYPDENRQRSMLPGTLSLTEAWINRQISNFDYLMQLNIQAGRSFNDITQYPVFPWVSCFYYFNL